MPIDAKTVGHFYERAHADRWRVARERFADALGASVDKAAPPDVHRYLTSLHLEDLALACACAAGDEAAWNHFVLAFRPILYRSADALDPNGGAREVADALYAELFGLNERGGERLSLFRYFHGRSSLATWLRAVLSQRYVDHVRSGRRLDALPDEEAPFALAAPEAEAFAPDRERHGALLRAALARAVANLDSRERLRLACYYAQDMTLAQTGRLLGEHEATCSRQLARTRKAIRADVEHQLRADEGLDYAAIAECIASVSEDAGELDLRQLLGASALHPRKESTVDRSR